MALENRWRAFTDDELEVLAAWCAFFDTATVRPGILDAEHVLIAEITSELSRRREDDDDA